MSAANRKLSILFLCTGNSCRSQMAEGWARELKGEVIEAFSAGIEKHGMNSLAVRVMAEAGVDISKQQPKLIDELPRLDFDYIITLCDHASESCPFFPGKIIHRGFADPPKLAANAKNEEEALVSYRLVRDRIKEFIATLPEALE
ncbi:MAG: arsenate reductase ArsC [Deltaproteobacteria bacterium]